MVKSYCFLCVYALKCRTLCKKEYKKLNIIFYKQMYSIIKREDLLQAKLVV